MAKGNHILNPLFGYSGNRYIISAIGKRDNYLSIANPVNLKFSHSHIDGVGFTITAWIYLPGSGALTDSFPLVNIGRENTNNYYGIQCSISSGKPKVNVMGTNGGIPGAGSNNRRTALCDTVLQKGVWNHIAWSCVGMAVSSPNWTISINGVSTTFSVSGTNTNLSVAYSGKGYIGNDGKATGVSTLPTCYLGDVTVHSKALSAGAAGSANAIPQMYASNNDGIDWMAPSPGGAYSATDASTLRSWWQMGTPVGQPTYPNITDDATFISSYNYPAVMSGTMSSSQIQDTPLWG